MKDNFEIVVNSITEQNVSSHFKYDFIPKRIESHLTIFNVYDLETHNTDRARPYRICFHRLSKFARRYNRDLTLEGREKCEKDTTTFDGDNCVEKALDFCLKLKREEYKDKEGKVLDYNLQLHAHIGSSFDTWIVLNNLPSDKKIVNITKNGKSVTELKVPNGYIERSKKQIHHYLHFRFVMTHLNYSLKIKVKLSNYKRSYLKLK